MAAAINALTILVNLRETLTAGVARMNAALNSLSASATRASRSVASVSVLSDRRFFANGMNATAAATRNAAAAHDQLAAAATRSERAVRRAAGGGAGGGRGGRGGGGGGGFNFTPYQQSLAAMGGMGYALGRGGPGVLLPLGAAYATYKSFQKFAEYENALFEVRKAANLTKQEMNTLGMMLDKTSFKYALPAENMAKMATELSLAGVRGLPNISMMSEEVAKALLVWQDADPQKTANILGKMWSLWYKDVPQGERSASLLGNFVDAVDFLEDNYPTSSGELMKSLERFLPVARNYGLTPEQAAAMSAAMMVAGPGSGERSGTRLAINWPRMEEEIRGNLKKKTVRERLPAPKNVKDMLDINPMLGVIMWFEHLRKSFKGQKGWQKKAQSIIAKGLGFESAKNIAPMFADLVNTMSMAGQFDVEAAKWALANEEFQKRLEELGPAGEELRRSLEKFIETGIAPYAGTAKRNAEMMAERVKHATGQLSNASNRLMRSWGRGVSPGIVTLAGGLTKLFNKVADAVDGVTGQFGKQEKDAGALVSEAKRRKEIRERGAYTGILSKDTPMSALSPYGPTPGVPGPGDRLVVDSNGRVLSVGSTGSRVLDQILGLTHQPRGLAGDARTPESLQKYLDERDRRQTESEGSQPLPGTPGSWGRWFHDFLFPPAHGGTAGAPLTSWPQSVPMGPPPIINQHTAAEPIVNQIPPPHVEVINNSVGLVNVHVTATPAMQSIMRNPGASPASGMSGDPSNKTGVTGQ